MIIFKTVEQLWQYLEKQRNTGKTIGFVPTMGALHEGHLSLVDLSRSRHPITVVSIFVNPAQFNDAKDFEKYPVTTSGDCKLLEMHQADILFLPSVTEMYPAGIARAKHFELGHLEEILEGAFRPGHFQGVCKAVQRLLEIVEPDGIFMGRKDFQQCVVVQRLIEMMGVPVELVKAPTRRENSGLAMSSRNVRLSDADRKIAPELFRQLEIIKTTWTTTDPAVLQQIAAQNLLDAGFKKVDYISIADPETLQPVYEYTPGMKAVVLAAAFLGEVRLIDNLELSI